MIAPSRVLTFVLLTTTLTSLPAASQPHGSDRRYSCEAGVEPAMNGCCTGLCDALREER